MPCASPNRTPPPHPTGQLPADQLSYESQMACRSILFRILRLAEDEGAIAANPVRKVPNPKRPMDPDQVFARRQPPRANSRGGRLLARFPLFWWDHVLCLLGTGLRFGGFAGLRVRRVHLDRAIPVLPLASLVVEAIRRQLPLNADSNDLVVTGPGGGNGVPLGTRTILSGHGFRRLYQNAAHRAQGDLTHLQLRGSHDLRHSFSIWLEDEGIPARVIDELMGRQCSRRGELDGGSRIGARYRHTTQEMAARVVQAVDLRLALVLQVAQAITPAEPGQGDRVFYAASRRSARNPGRARVSGAVASRLRGLRAPQDGVDLPGSRSPAFLVSSVLGALSGRAAANGRPDAVASRAAGARAGAELAAVRRRDRGGDRHLDGGRIGSAGRSWTAGRRGRHPERRESLGAASQSAGQ